MAKAIRDLNDIDLDLSEGRLAFGLLCMVTTTIRSDKTPDETIREALELVEATLDLRQVTGE